MKKTFLIVLTIIIMSFFIWTGFLWKIFSNGFAGSYPYAETWDLKATESELIEIIKEIKLEHPELQPPAYLDLTEGREKNWDSADLYDPSSVTSPQYSYWYDINFYYPDTKEVVHTWIRADFDSTVTTLALINFSVHEKNEIPPIDSLGIKLGLTQGEKFETKTTSRTINRDFGYFANRKKIKKFEEIVVDRIKEKLRKQSSVLTAVLRICRRFCKS